MEPSNLSLKWYQKMRNIFLVGCGGIVVVVGGIFVGLMVYYYHTISSGKGALLAERFARGGATVLPGSFSVAASSSIQNTSGVIERDRLEVGDYPVLGAKKPATTIVEFVDFKCPNCKIGAPIMRRLIAEHGSEIKLVSRQAPFESLHPGATQFAQIGWCAGQQGRYWAMHDYFFAEQDTLPAQFSGTDLEKLAQRFGFDVPAFLTCLADRRSLVAINKEYNEAVELGVRGTPTFFVNGSKVEGVVSYQSWTDVLNLSTKK